MKNSMIVTFLFIILFFSCKDNPTETVSNDFSFEVNVVNGNSENLPDVKISMWYKFQTATSSFPKKDESGKINETTSIRFSLEKKLFTNVNLYDLDDHLYKALINNEELNAGSYVYKYSNNDKIGTGVFKCKMELKEDSLSATSVFADSIYIVILCPDAAVAEIGITDQNGNFQTSNKLLFPSLYELPLLVRTNENADFLGNFTISDEIVIALTNSNSEIKYYNEIISGSKNNFVLNWEEGSDDNLYPKQNRSFYKNNSQLKEIGDTNTTIIAESKLFQNYPNPYN